MRTALITHEDCHRHEMGELHPESPQRLEAILNAIREEGISERLRIYEAPLADRTAVERIHGAQYLAGLHQALPKAGYTPLDPDTRLNPHSLQAAYRAAGAVCLAVDLVRKGEVQRAFCAVRPPGHHAEPGEAMGFCLFNNVAVGAAQALETWRLKRVAIVDFDVHHGNGTETAFQNDPRVLFCSSFQHPFYPGRPFASPDHPHIRNLPLPEGTGSATFRQAVETYWLPALREFRPELLFFSAGFDAHEEDPLGGFRLRDDDYTWVTRRVCAATEPSSQGRVISALEGGYHLSTLARCSVLHLKALMGDA